MTRPRWLIAACLLATACSTSVPPATLAPPILRTADPPSAIPSAGVTNGSAAASDASCSTGDGTSTAAQFVPGGKLGRADLAKAYEIAPLYDQYQLDGSGQTVAIASFGGWYDAADIAMFNTVTGTAKGSLERIPMPAGAPIGTPGKSDAETLLDIETIRTIAPGATILDYQSCRLDFGDVVQKIVDEGRASVISISYGLCETVYNALASNTIAAAERWPSMADVEGHFATAAAAGTSIFVSSGDEGAYGCERIARRLAKDEPALAHTLYFSADAEFPATSPSVTAVGGTYLSVANDGSYFREAAWEDSLTQTGTGGGVSATFNRPDWQVGLGAALSSTGRRQVPDIAGPGDSDSGMGLIRARTCDPGEVDPCWTSDAVGGTSFAAPLWAGIAVLAAQLAQQRGLGPIGPLAPRLYRLANGPAYHDLFHDVTLGGNLQDLAGAGWDSATGWGSPRVTPLVLALMDDLRAHPTVVQPGG